MLAARDQENLVHGHQAAAASKPLNQGSKQLPPKTPGNRIPKTPFKIPLNDENGGLGGGKGGLKANGKGDENMATGMKKGALGNKNAFVTPMGPRTRAPLGAKTTNAKTKAFQTPAPVHNENDLGKPSQKSASARKAKPKVHHAEMTKVEVLGDKDETEEREIEYMPPRGEDMPDLPDDHFEIDTSIFENGGHMRGAIQYFKTRKDDEGLSIADREQQRQERIWSAAERRMEAKLLRDCESDNIPCTHNVECPGTVCKNMIEIRRVAEEKYQKTLAKIDADSAPKQTKPDLTEGPSTMKAKSAAAALSKPGVTINASKGTAKAGNQPSKAGPGPSLAPRSKKAPTPSNPSPMRHTAAVAASKTTMGYAKGRSTSATLRKTVMPKKGPEMPDISLPPAEYIRRYGEPRLGSDMWIRCKRAGCFDEDEGPSLEELFAADEPNALDRLIREQAEEDFQLTF